MLLLPVIPTLAVARSRAPEAALTYLGMAAVLMPMPIALAIGRYKLFDLEADARRWVAHGLYFAAAALIVSTAFAVAGWKGNSVELFALAFVCAVGIEWMRRRLLGLLESRLSPHVSKLRELRTEFAREIGSLREPDAVACLLGETLQRALDANGGCVFLLEGAAWRPVYVAGKNSPAQSRLARDALSVLEDRPLLYLLANGESWTPARGRLRDAGVELVVRLDHRGQPLGLVLLGQSQARVPYTGVDLDFAAMAANQGALALHNAHLAADLAFAEQQAATARVALVLVHQVGKELDWICGLSRRLSSRLSDPHRAQRDIASIQELSDDLARSVRGFLRDAIRGAPDRPGVRPLEPLIDRAVLAATRSHGEGRVAKSLDPQLRGVAVDACLERVIVSLLDNALHASPVDFPVRLSFSLKEAWIEIAVADQGCGMTNQELQRAFELGFTTRPDRGSGVGLALSKETVESLSGSIHLDSHPGEGTRVSLRVPLRS
jgi:signal transduction histidine kinase